MATKVSVKVNKPQGGFSTNKAGEDTNGSSVIDLRSQSVSAPETPASEPEERQAANGQEERGYADLEHVSGGRDVPTQEVHGILDIAGEGHGFLRPKFRIP